MHYPHMSPLDLRVWRRFLVLMPDFFSELRYDVRVGTGSHGWTDQEEEKPMDWLRMTQKRLDAVGRHGEEIALIEVKPRASFTALGQLLVYRDLYQEQEKPTSHVGMWVVCAETDRDLEPTFRRYGVEVLAVGE